MNQWKWHDFVILLILIDYHCVQRGYTKRAVNNKKITHVYIPNQQQKQTPIIITEPCR